MLPSALCYYFVIAPSFFLKGVLTMSLRLSYSCPKCNVVFLHKRSLTLHLKQNCKVAKKTYNCPFCHDNLFAQKRDLVRHLIHQHNDQNTEALNDLLDDKKPAAISDNTGCNFDDMSIRCDDNSQKDIAFENSNHQDDLFVAASNTSACEIDHNVASLKRKVFLSLDDFYDLDGKKQRQYEDNAYDSDETTVHKDNCLNTTTDLGMTHKVLDIQENNIEKNWTDLEDPFIPNDSVSFNVEELVIVDTVDEAVAEAIQDISISLEENHNGITDLQYSQLMAQGHVNKLDQQKLCQISLLKLLDGNNAPLHLFDDIMRWAEKSKVVNSYNFESPAPQRKTLIRNLIEQSHYQSLLPKSIKFLLPQAQQFVKITTHNVLASLFSLLTDNQLMTDENLIFKDNPFEDPNLDRSCYIEDINDGSCYKQAFIKYCKDPKKDVMCPIILFIDKTHTDAKGNQTLEPVCMTLGIFNATTRNKESAWRIIGFIPSSSTITGRKLTSSQKRSDYHAMLQVVLAPLEQLQKCHGLAFDMTYKNTKLSVSLKIPILFICGDSEGQDKLVGRRLTYHSIGEGMHICRYCNVPYTETDNPHFKSKLTKASKIAKYIQEHKAEKLNAIGYCPIDKNALHQLSFCDDEYGLNGSLPADLLHTFQLGILIYVVDAFFALKRPNLDAMRKNEKHCFSKRRSKKDVATARLDDDSLSLSIEERSSLNVFNDVEKDIFDSRARLIGKRLSQQSDRDLPRTHFPTGITGDKKKNGHEMQGVILDILCVLLSDVSKYERLMGDNNIGVRRLSNWVLLLERLLLVEEFLRTNAFKRTHIMIFKVYFPYFLEYLKKVVDRQSHAKFKLLKYHLCTHFASDIMKWGPPCCYNSSTGESNHKSLKIRTRKTQRQNDLIEEQTAVRYVEQLAIHHSLGLMVNQEMIHKGKKYIQQSKSPTWLGGLSYCQTANGIKKVVNGFVAEDAEWISGKLQNSLNTLFLSYILPHVKGRTINYYTTANIGNDLYRGDPSYKKNIWQDWAHCDWGDFGSIPVHILIFVDLMCLKDCIIDIDGVVDIPGPDKYAIVHMIKDPLEADIYDKNTKQHNYKAHPRSVLCHTASKLMDIKTKEPAIAFVSLSSIQSPCLAIHQDNAKQNQSNSYLFLQSKTKWNSIFVKSMRRSLEDKKFRLY